MLVFALAFWLGALFYALNLSLGFGLAMLTLSLFLPPFRQTICLGLILGFLYLSLAFFWCFPPLPANECNQWVSVEGVIERLITVTKHRQKFYFVIERLNDKPFKQTVIASFYQQVPPLSSGERWQFRAKLKPIRGFKNPGVRDDEKTALAHAVKLKGTFKNPVLRHKAPRYSIETFRRMLLARIDNALAEKPYKSIIESLSLGYKNNLSYQTKQLFRDTGTSHLMAISGLHVGLIAAFSFFVSKRLWRLSARLCLWLSAPRAAALLSLFVAILYSALTGFAIPTQRAIIMLSVFLLSIFFRLKIPVWHAYAISLVLVILISPFSVLSPGFYLSFYAVFILLFLATKKGMLSFIKMQALLILALSPLSLFYFSYLSLSAFPANLVAIPAIASLLLPLIFCTVVVLMLNVTLGTWLLSLSELLSGYLIKYLQWIQSLGFQSFQGVHLSAGSLCLLILAVVIFLLPKRIFLWPLSLFCLLPVLFPLAPRLSDGEAFINVLDVGQGSAILIRTREETILYDAGPKWYGGGDAAKSVIIPYFKSQKITRLDKLIISHQDIDHRGGAESLKKEITVLKTIDNKKKSLHSCFEYPAWQSGGVSFHFLRNNRHFLSENNRSCLLMISVANNRFFLTGDIEKSVEKRLVQNVPELSANYLMAPHHGSNSSSLRAFIKAVNPKAVMFSTGYLNRFNFPKEEVLKRYQGMTLLNTAKCGMISFKLSSVYQTPKCYVLNESHFGHYLPL